MPQSWPFLQQSRGPARGSAPTTVTVFFPGVFFRIVKSLANSQDDIGKAGEVPRCRRRVRPPFGPGTATGRRRGVVGRRRAVGRHGLLSRLVGRGWREHSTYCVPTPRSKVVSNGTHGQNLSLARRGRRPAGRGPLCAFFVAAELTYARFLGFTFDRLTFFSAPREPAMSILLVEDDIELARLADRAFSRKWLLRVAQVQTAKRA